ncbi:hypothetical protein AURDEDRAFT_162961 [Auricularia subglabra TFB-10046 SS5]|nr:hypothetical protein AURDEDRAFT_162961 [Auricularia subglabra TFB-10046 SS5]
MVRDIGTTFAVPPGTISIEWPRSDGDPKNRPDQPTKPTDGTVNFYRLVEPTEPSHQRWRFEIATRMAAHVPRLDAKKKYMFTSWPSGYELFDHNKGPREQPRHDLYLYGSNTATKFRSVNEFVPHAIWLFREHEGEACGCKYCSKSKNQGEITAQYGLPLGMGKELPPPVTVRKIVRPVFVPAPDQHVPRARDADLRAALKLERRYRIGEIVWCELNPPIAHPKKPTLCLEFWPAIVREIRLSNKVTERKPLPEQPSSAGTSKAAARAEYSVKQTHNYKVQLIGVRHMHILPEGELLPYMAWNPNDDLITYLKDFGAAQLPPRLSDDLRELFDFSPMPQSTLCPQDPVSDAPAGALFAPPENPPQGEWKDAIGPFSLALQISAFASNYWALTDEWEFRARSPAKASLPKLFDTPFASADPSPASSPVKPFRPETQSSPVQPTQQQQQQQKDAPAEVRYQGVWWGAERIWQDDIVRLVPYRDQLGINELLESSPDAETRTLFLHITSIFVDASSEHPRGRVAGILYELAPAGWDASRQPARSADPLSAPTRGAYALPPPPPPFVFRALMPSGLEAVLDIAMVAGRFYGDLLAMPPVARRVPDPPPQPGTEGFSAFEQLLGLCGAAPSSKFNMGCLEWKPSRAEMFTEADRVSRERLYMHWFGIKDESFKEEVDEIAMHGMHPDDPMIID